MPEAGDSQQRNQPRQPTEQELRELAVRGETLRQQLGSMEAQQTYVGELLAEARQSVQALEHLASGPTEDEVLVPLGGGAFVHAKLVEADKVVTALGSGIHAELPVADAVERMRSRVQNLETSAGNLSREINRYMQEMQQINSVLEGYYSGGA